MNQQPEPKHRVIVLRPEHRAKLNKAYQEILNNSTEADEDGCINCLYAISSDGYKYPIKKIIKKTLGCHIIALCKKYADANKPAWPDNYDVSHLCGNRFCVSLDHLIAEDHIANQERNDCPPTVQCKFCYVSINACECVPPCRKPIKQGVCQDCQP